MAEEVTRKMVVLTMPEVNAIVAGGIGIGVGLYMFVSGCIELYQLEKGTHPSQKDFKRGYEHGKFMGKLDYILEQIKADIEEAKHKRESKQTKDNSESTENETESE